VLEAEDAVLGALVANPGFHEPTFFERSGWETIVLSVVLGLVVLVLFGLTLRIARSESGPAPSEVTAPRRDGKANDAKADDAKADDAKPDDAKPDDAKPDDAKSDDAKPDDAKPDDTKADDAKPDDAKPDDAKPEGDVPPESGGA
jgi:hypothetical protein